MKLESDRQRLVFLIFLTSLVTLIPLLKNDVILKDSIMYLHSAQFISMGDWEKTLQHYKMPFYPLLISIVHFVVRDFALAGQLVNILAIALSTVPLYKLCAHLLDRDKAFVSCLFYAVSPSFHGAAVEVTREATFIFFLAWFLYFFITASSQNKKKYAFAFLCAFFAALSRVEGIFLVAISLFSLFWQGMRSSSPKIKAFTFSTLAVFALSFGFVVYHYEQGKYKINRLEDGLRILKHPVQYYKGLRIHQVRKALRTFANQMPGRKDTEGGLLDTARNAFFEIYLISLFKTVFRTCFPIAFILAAAGIYHEMPFKNKGKQKQLLCFLSLYLAIPYLALFQYNFISHRYVLAASFIFHAWVGSGFFALTSLLRGKFKEKWAFLSSPKFVGLSLVLLLSIPVVRIAAERTGRESNLKEAGAWIRQHVPQGKIVTNDPRILYYGGIVAPTGSPMDVDSGEYADLERRAAQLKCEWIVFRCESSKVEKPGYQMLFEGKRPIVVYRLDE